MEDLCDEGLDLKRQLVKEFEEADTRTYRLCFAVKTKPKSGLFGSVIINKKREKRAQGDIFEILHTRDFNPNSKDFVVFKHNVTKENIGAHLAQLCDQFYELKGMEVQKQIQLAILGDAIVTSHKQIYQCKNCLTMYDEFYGDDINNIIAGTKFETIEHYFCPTCTSPKQDFVLVDELSILNN